jgi:hypothetical protein
MGEQVYYRASRPSMARGAPPSEAREALATVMSHAGASTMLRSLPRRRQKAALKLPRLWIEIRMSPFNWHIAHRGRVVSRSR